MILISLHNSFFCRQQWAQGLEEGSPILISKSLRPIVPAPIYFSIHNFKNRNRLVCHLHLNINLVQTFDFSEELIFTNENTVASSELVISVSVLLVLCDLMQITWAFWFSFDICHMKGCLWTFSSSSLSLYIVYIITFQGQPSQSQIKRSIGTFFLILLYLLTWNIQPPASSLF